MENPNLVLQEMGNSQTPTHSRLAEYFSQKAIQTMTYQTEWSLLSTGVTDDM